MKIGATITEFDEDVARQAADDARERKRQKTEKAKRQKLDLANDPYLKRISELSPDHDPESVLLGHKWLRRGETNCLVSMAGIGKSVAGNGGAVLWAIGETYLGISPERPLRVALFVSEDDETTVAEQREGLYENAELIIGRKLSEKEKQLADQNLIVDFSLELSGVEFVATRVRAVAEFQEADLIIINPLLGYVGGDIVKEGPPLLRNCLTPALRDLNAGALVINHTPKLAKEGMEGINQTYSQIGGGDMANIPRSIVVINPTKHPEIFRLTASKRLTTGWEDEEGKFVPEHYVRRSGDPQRPAWISMGYYEAKEEIAAEAGEENEPQAKVRGIHVRDAFNCETGREMPKSELIEYLTDRCDAGLTTVKAALNGMKGSVWMVSRTEARPRGGRPIEIVKLAGGE